MMKNNDPKITVDPIVYAEKPTQYKAVAEPAGDGDAYRELRVGFFDEEGKCVPTLPSIPTPASRGF